MRDSLPFRSPDNGMRITFNPGDQPDETHIGHDALEAFAPLVDQRPAAVLSFLKRLSAEAGHDPRQRLPAVAVVSVAEEPAAHRDRDGQREVPGLMPLF